MVILGRSSEGPRAHGPSSSIGRLGHTSKGRASKARVQRRRKRPSAECWSAPMLPSSTGSTLVLLHSAANAPSVPSSPPALMTPCYSKPFFHRMDRNRLPGLR